MIIVIFYYCEMSHQMLAGTISNPLSLFPIPSYSCHRNGMKMGICFSQSASQWRPPIWQ